MFPPGLSAHLIFNEVHNSERQQASCCTHSERVGKVQYCFYEVQKRGVAEHKPYHISFNLFRIDPFCLADCLLAFSVDDTNIDV